MKSFRAVKSNMDKLMVDFAVKITNASIKSNSTSTTFDLQETANRIQFAFEENYSLHWSVLIGVDMYTAVRYCSKSFCVLTYDNGKEWKRHDGKIEKRALTILIFKPLSNLNESLPMRSSESDNVSNSLKNSKSRILNHSDTLSVEDLNLVVDSVTTAFNSVSSQKMDDAAMIRLVQNVRLEINTNFGRMWHVVLSKLGDIFAALPKFMDDDSIEMSLNSKYKIYIWRHKAPQPNVISKMVRSPSAYFFFASLLVFVVWYSKRNCGPASCSFNIPPCTLGEANTELEICTQRAGYYFVASILLLLMSLITRRTDDIAKKTKRRKWIENINSIESPTVTTAASSDKAASSTSETKKTR